jgi:hypothetical protein
MGLIWPHFQLGRIGREMKRNLELDAALQGMEEGNMVARSIMETLAPVVEGDDSRWNRALSLYSLWDSS